MSTGKGLANDMTIMTVITPYGVGASALSVGLLSAMISDVAPSDLRGTAFGVFNLASGIALLAASIIAGSLWTAVGPAMTFYAGAAFSCAALASLLTDARKTVT